MLTEDQKVAALATLAAEADRPPPSPPTLLDTTADLYRELALADEEIGELQRAIEELYMAPVYGLDPAQDASHHGEVLPIFGDPQAWHDAGREGALVVDWTAPNLVRLLWLDEHSRVLCDSHESARKLIAALCRNGVRVQGIKVGAADGGGQDAA